MEESQKTTIEKLKRENAKLKNSLYSMNCFVSIVLIVWLYNRFEFPMWIQVVIYLAFFVLLALLIRYFVRAFKLRKL